MAKAKQLSAVVARDKQIVEENKANVEKLQLKRLQQIRELHQVIFKHGVKYSIPYSTVNLPVLSRLLY